MMAEIFGNREYGTQNMSEIVVTINSDAQRYFVLEAISCDNYFLEVVMIISENKFVQPKELWSNESKDRNAFIQAREFLFQNKKKGVM